MHVERERIDFPPSNEIFKNENSAITKQFSEDGCHEYLKDQLDVQKRKARESHVTDDSNKSSFHSDFPSILVAPDDDGFLSPSGFVQCCIIRDPKLQSARYTMSFQRKGLQDKAAIVAIKQSNTRTSNYHFFDVSRRDEDCNIEFKLNKKAGNYIGKLRRDETKRSAYSLFNSKDSKEQSAAFLYHVPSWISQWREGQPPRRVTAILPTLDPKNYSKSCQITNENKMIDSFENGCGSSEVLVMETREPSYEGGQYRLNFGGRVTTPSVKNMQLVGDDGKLLVQFGRVGENRFHLDYRSPFNGYQAFALAITQFDL
eukprot:CAMPEP_0194361534 /NCGR_PEP_ID=MMETSP0174-20130528/9098_1 /TAXON_ID=216777 /ORGANISM="Proboscia alata, Strain PI-D3" /LENGTH=314 /DNA_ID=CAMNT_0039133785 /DNA_START=55 /DNA_END=999 /DNA_ORIENTATION=-